MSFLKDDIFRMMGLEKRVYQVARDQIGKNAQLIVDLLQDQLRSSQMSDGSLAPAYEESTEVFANEELQATSGQYPRNPNKGEYYNFEWTGQFFDSMKVRITNEEFIIEAAPESLAFLRSGKSGQKLRGREFMELQKETAQDLIEKQVLPEIYKLIFHELAKTVSS